MENQKYRSQNWFGKKGKDGFIYRAWMKNQGTPPDMFDGRPVIGICNTWSELTPCNGHFKELAEAVEILSPTTLGIQSLETSELVATLTQIKNEGKKHPLYLLRFILNPLIFYLLI